MLLVLVAMLWTNAASYRSWTMENERQCWELYDPIDGEGEKKEEKENEEDKYNDTELEACKLEAASSKKLAKLLHALHLQSLHHPEMPTPPPECAISA